MNTAWSSTKYVPEQGIVMANLWKNIQTFPLHSSIFFFRKTTSKSKFSNFFLPLIKLFVATFSEALAPTSRTFVAEQGILISNWSNFFQTFRSYSSVFALQKQSKNLIFQIFFTSKRPFVGYFQLNVCSNFQKRSSWTSYGDAKFLKITSSV